MATAVVRPRVHHRSPRGRRRGGAVVDARASCMNFLTRGVSLSRGWTVLTCESSRSARTAVSQTGQRNILTGGFDRAFTCPPLLPRGPRGNYGLAPHRTPPSRGPQKVREDPRQPLPGIQTVSLRPEARRRAVGERCGKKPRPCGGAPQPPHSPSSPNLGRRGRPTPRPTPDPLRVVPCSLDAA